MRRRSFTFPPVPWIASPIQRFFVHSNALIAELQVTACVAQRFVVLPLADVLSCASNISTLRERVS